MPLTDAGRNHIAADLVGEAVTEFSNAGARLGVGDSNAAFAKAQTDLQAAVNKVRKAMDLTFPTRAVNVLTFRATFGLAEANFAWEEWGLFNAAAAGTMLNRRVASMGTKPGTETWEMTVTCTLGNP